MPAKTSNNTLLNRLEPFDDDSGDLNVIIETPKGRRNKYDYDPEVGAIKLKKVLPAGAVFPFDFGCVPGTLGEDGDPLDVLLIMDEPAYPGCILTARLIGVIEAEQTERDGKPIRNDRLIAVATESHDHGDIKELAQLNDNLVEEIEHFFESYNEFRRKSFKPLRRAGPERAKALVQKGIEAYKKDKK